MTSGFFSRGSAKCTPLAQALGYGEGKSLTNAVANHVDPEDKKNAPIQGNLGGLQEMTIINESGLYSLVLSSKLPGKGGLFQNSLCNVRSQQRRPRRECVESTRPAGPYCLSYTGCYTSMGSNGQSFRRCSFAFIRIFCPAVSAAVAAAVNLSA